MTAFIDAVRLLAGDIDETHLITDAQVLGIARPLVKTENGVSVVNVVGVATRLCRLLSTYIPDSRPLFVERMDKRAGELENILRADGPEAHEVTVADNVSLDPIDQNAIAAIVAGLLTWTITQNRVTSTGIVYDVNVAIGTGAAMKVGEFTSPGGPAGLSIQSVAVDSNDHLIVTLTDGSTYDAGMLPVSTAAGLGAAQVQNLIDTSGHADQTDLDAHEASTHNTDATARAAAAAAQTEIDSHESNHPQSGPSQADVDSSITAHAGDDDAHHPPVDISGKADQTELDSHEGSTHNTDTTARTAAAGAESDLASHVANHPGGVGGIPADGAVGRTQLSPSVVTDIDAHADQSELDAHEASTHNVDATARSEALAAQGLITGHQVAASPHNTAIATLIEAHRAVATAHQQPGGGGGSGLPTPATAADRAIRWNGTAWEAYSPSSKYYYALTVSNTNGTMSAGLRDALVNGPSGDERQRDHAAPNRLAYAQSNFFSAANETFIFYRTDIIPVSTWAAHADNPITVFETSPLYVWILAPTDAGEYETYRWTLKSFGGDRLDNEPSFTEVNQRLVIDGVEYTVYRAILMWEAGTTNRHFQLSVVRGPTANPTLVWQ